MASNFAGWLFFHASYFEKANLAKTKRTEAVRKALTLIKDKQETLTDDRLDYWMKRISEMYEGVSRLNSTMDGVRSYFLTGTIIGLLGALLELLQTPAPWDSFTLTISAICFVVAVMNGNSMMKVLSQPSTS